MPEVEFKVNVSGWTLVFVPLVMIISALSIYLAVAQDTTGSETQIESHGGIHNAANHYILAQATFIFAFIGIIMQSHHWSFNWIKSLYWPAIGIIIACQANVIRVLPGQAADGYGDIINFSFGSINIFRVAWENKWDLPYDVQLSLIGGVLYHLSGSIATSLAQMRISGRPNSAGVSRKEGWVTAVIAVCGLVSTATLWSAFGEASEADAGNGTYASVFTIIWTQVAVVFFQISAVLNGSAFLYELNLYIIGLLGWNVLQNMFQIKASLNAQPGYSISDNFDDIARIETGCAFGFVAVVFATYAALAALGGKGEQDGGYSNVPLLGMCLSFVIILVGSALQLRGLWEVNENILNGADQYSDISSAAHWYIMVSWLWAFGFSLRSVDKPLAKSLAPLWWMAVGAGTATWVGWSSVATHDGSSPARWTDASFAGLNLQRIISEDYSDYGTDQHESTFNKSFAGNVMVALGAFLSYAVGAINPGRSDNLGSTSTSVKLAPISVVFGVIGCILCWSSSGANAGDLPTKFFEGSMSNTNIFSMALDSVPYYDMIFQGTALSLIVTAATNSAFLFGDRASLKLAGITAGMLWLDVAGSFFLTVGNEGDETCSVNPYSPLSDQFDGEDCNLVLTGFLFMGIQAILAMCLVCNQLQSDTTLGTPTVTDDSSSRVSDV